MSYTCSLSSCPFLLSKGGPHRVVTSAHGVFVCWGLSPDNDVPFGTPRGKLPASVGGRWCETLTGRDNGQIPNLWQGKTRIDQWWNGIVKLLSVVIVFFSHGLSTLTIRERTPESSTKIRVVIVVYEIQLDSHPSTPRYYHSDKVKQLLLELLELIIIKWW